MNMPSLIRLDRLLVARGLGGRRLVQRLIKRGEVSAEGELLNRPELRVASTIELMVSGEISKPTPSLLVYHKPVGQLSTLRDPWGREGLDQALPTRWRELFHPVGRLDADTSGLLLFSSDGALTQRLLHPKREIPRTYLAHVSALPTDLETQLTTGVETALGNFTARLERVERLSPEAPRPAGAEAAVAELEVTVCEGKHRMVRRMLHNAGASVLALHRLRYGCISLVCRSTESRIPEGGWREVSESELASLTTMR